MYVDESGDTGRKPGSTRYFCLSGIAVHESDWREYVNRLIAFRRVLRDNYNLPLRAEIHASEYMQRAVFGIEKYKRLAILRNSLDELAKLPFISITNILVDKEGKPQDYDVLQAAWGVLFQRFENTMQSGNLPGNHNEDFGMVITDAVSGKKLIRLTRKMAVHNPIPNNPFYGPGTRNMPIVKIIEDPSGRDSGESLPIQMCDVSAYFLKQSVDPSVYLRKKAATNYFSRLEPVLNKRASGRDRLGVVRI
ncbi:MAG: DUF3800 domain-containing protein [Fimbriimonadaceae bacterium]|nr:DUF3800 domain-containing protein [Alphaproteobacteria bacterium]